MSGSYTTNVPSPTFGPTGFILPAESAILAGAQADINAAFGGALSQNLETPQGQIASSLTAIIGDQNAQYLQLTNQVDPAFAAGRMQDAIGRIYFITRIAGTGTVTQVTCSGKTGVQIPVGALLQAADGNLYSCTLLGQIPSAGSIVLPFQCLTTGPIACPAQTFTIYQTIFGWDSAISVSGGVQGIAVETRAAFELRRQQSVAQNALGTIPAILGAVLSVSGVLDAYVIDNPTNSPATIGGITIGANALYVGVYGGLASAVAFAIWQKKQPGCPYYAGNTTQTVYDPSPTYSTPPAYTVIFETPPAVPVYIVATVKNSTAVPSTALASIQTAVQLAFAGGDGGTRACMGSTLYASRYYAGVAALGAWAQIVQIQIGSVVAATGTGVIAGTALTISGTVTGTWAVGQLVVGTNVLAGTLITALGSGSGGAGTYTVGISQTAASGATSGITMGNSTSMTIAQEPTIQAAAISLILQ
jgi:hypothetical protein